MGVTGELLTNGQSPYYSRSLAVKHSTTTTTTITTTTTTTTTTAVYKQRYTNPFSPSWHGWQWCWAVRKLRRGGEKMREFWVWTRERVFGKPGGDKRKGSRETTTPVKVCGCMESVITGGYSFENSTVTSVRRVLWFPQRLIPSYLLVRSVSLFYIRSHPLYLRLPSIFCRCCKRAR